MSSTVDQHPKESIRSRFLSKFQNIGIRPNDPDELQVKKNVLVASIVLNSIAAVFWALFYFILGFDIPALIPFVYALLCWITVYHFKLRKNFEVFRNSQLILIMLLPFFLMISLHGFINSSSVIYWSVLAPFAAIIFTDQKKAPYWFIIFLALLLGSTIYELFYPAEIVIPQPIIISFFFLNIAGVSTILFFTVYYFVGERDKAYHLLQQIAEQQFSGLIDDLDIEGTLTSVDQLTTTSIPVLLLIINRGGLANYSRVFVEKEGYNDQLISGFLTAISAFSQEAFGAHILKEITYKDFRIYFDELGEMKVVYAFQGSKLDAQHRFDQLLEQFRTPEIEHLLRNDYISVDENETINDIVDDIFTSESDE